MKLRITMEIRILFMFLFAIAITVSSANKNANVTQIQEQWPMDVLHNKSSIYDEKRGKSQTWSGWSEWSTCSRTCDGGVAHQLRRCHAQQGGCKGDPVRYKICNMQPCPDSQDFRSHQCSAYDEVPYDGMFYKWVPHYDYNEPCALTCRGKPAELPDEAPETEEDEAADSVGEDEPSVIVQLAARVQDGTRCRTGSLDMCIQGKCQRVGCDLKIGSTKKVDVCGVCGGDGSSCPQPMYHWEASAMSLCSATCGGGYRMARPICKNRVTGSEVEDTLCSGVARPEPTVVHCNTHLCPPNWIADEWGPCSKVCGSGIRERRIVCAEETNGAKIRVADATCVGQRPPTQELCNVHQCPQWETSEWSGCSVSCGKGIQVRSVECVEVTGALSTQCEPHTKPTAMQTCSTGISCSKYGNRKGFDDDDQMEEDEPYEGPRTLPLSAPDSKPRAEKLVSESQQRIPNEATFVVDSEWGPCSVTCGEGIRKRPFRCKIFLESSKTTPTLNDTLCPGVKPADEVERCYLDPCSMSYGYDPSFPRDTSNRNPIPDFKVHAAVPGKTYSWHEQGYTSCSASCLGGVEELIINCVRDDTGKVVSPFLCNQDTKPEARIRTCNDHQCPPRWNYSDYSPCSKSCGIGIKTREVQCIHEVARGGENTMVVPNSMCPQPMPSDRQYCNVLDCPVRWEVSEWGKCSKSCGSGIKDRRVECKQIMAQEHKVERPETMCPGARPSDKKPCNTKPCAPENQKPPIASSNTTYIQHDQKKQKVTLKVGGAAEVFYGTQVKVKCPVKGRFNRTRINWTKDSHLLSQTRRIKMSQKGALRILNITYRDSGIYTCHAGMSSVNLNVTVKPKLGDDASMNDYEKYRANIESRRRNPGGQQISEERSPRPRNRDRGRNKQKNIQNSDTMENEEQFRSRSQVSAFDFTTINSATSSGSRTLPLPHLKHLLASLQLLLWPFQSFSNSKGHNLLVERGQYYPFEMPMDTASDTGFGKDHQELLRNQVKVERDEDTPKPDVDEEVLELEAIKHKIRHKPDKNIGDRINQIFSVNTKGVVLGQGSPSKLKFDWMITPWSRCSLACDSAGVGFKLRSAHCIVRLENSTQSVDNTLCEDAGLELPETVDKCGGDNCPKWEAEAWKPCFKAKCTAWHKAVQKRQVHCGLNGTRVKDRECAKDDEKPPVKRECYNEQCKGVWRIDPWSECTGICDGQGVKYRTIRCVWYGTKRAAGTACKDQPRPIVMKPCRMSSCSTPASPAQKTVAASHPSVNPLPDDDCRDTVRHCSNAHVMGLCRLHRFQLLCCKSCRAL